MASLKQRQLRAFKPAGLVKEGTGSNKGSCVPEMRRLETGIAQVSGEKACHSCAQCGLQTLFSWTEVIRQNQIVLGGRGLRGQGEPMDSM